MVAVVAVRGGLVMMRWWRCDAMAMARPQVRTYVHLCRRKDEGRTDQENLLLFCSSFFLIKTKKYLQAGLAHLQLARKVCQLRSTAACRTLDTQTLLIGDDNKEHLQNIQESLPRLPR